MLLEFGISGSVARFLSDHKDNINGGEYGSVLLTGMRVFLLQGGLILLLGTVAALIGPWALDLPAHLASTFRNLVFIQSLITGITLVSRSLSAPLWPNQRQDLINLSATASLFVSFIVMWAGLHLGMGLYSMAFAGTAMLVTGSTISAISCRKLKLYPSKGCWGTYQPALLFSMLGYAKSIFMLNVGWQLISASQVMVIGRTLGLEAASVWSISTKMAQLVQQFVLKIFDSSASGLAELLVRGEQEKFRDRCKDILSITSVLAILGGSGIMMFNQPFLDIWTSGKIHWEGYNNLLLGIVIFSICITKTQIGIVSLDKNIAGIKYVTLLEGIIFVISSAILVQKFGFPAILASSILCNVLITGTYSLFRISQLFSVPAKIIAGWTKKSALLFIPLTILHLIISASAIPQMPLPLQIAIAIPIYLLLIIPATFFWATPKRMRDLIGKNIRTFIARPAVIFFRKAN